jgi:hypothetical protein
MDGLLTGVSGVELNLFGSEFGLLMEGFSSRFMFGF